MVSPLVPKPLVRGAATYRPRSYCRVGRPYSPKCVEGLFSEVRLQKWPPGRCADLGARPTLGLRGRASPFRRLTPGPPATRPHSTAILLQRGLHRAPSAAGPIGPARWGLSRNVGVTAFYSNGQKH